MKRARIALYSLGLVAGLVVVVASCGGTTPSSDVPPPVPPKPTTAPTASVAAAPTAAPIDFNDPKSVHVAAWTDDLAVRALAQDCHWDPGKCFSMIEASAPLSVDEIDFLPEGAARPEDDVRVLPPVACKALQPLACARVPSQSCVPDECSQSNYDCYPACAKTCAGCADGCATSCEVCKAPCKDDACKLACAKTCGECRQTCLTSLDHCTTAECSEKQETCFRERDDAWTKSVCPKVCPKVQACVERCPPIENDYSGQLYVSPCAVKCLSSFGKGCPASFNHICAGDPNASVNFNAYHARRLAEQAK